MLLLFFLYFFASYFVCLLVGLFPFFLPSFLPSFFLSFFLSFFPSFFLSFPLSFVLLLFTRSHRIHKLGKYQWDPIGEAFNRLLTDSYSFLVPLTDCKMVPANKPQLNFKSSKLFKRKNAESSERTITFLPQFIEGDHWEDTSVTHLQSVTP